MRAEFAIRRELTCGLLQQILGVKLPVPDGAFYASSSMSPRTLGKTFKDKPVTDSLSFCGRAAGASPRKPRAGCRLSAAEDFVRMSFATSREAIEGGISRLKDWLQSRAGRRTPAARPGCATCRPSRRATCRSSGRRRPVGRVTSHQSAARHPRPCGRGSPREFVMSILYLTEAEVARVLTMELALDTTAAAFRKLALEEDDECARAAVPDRSLSHCTYSRPPRRRARGDSASAYTASKTGSRSSTSALFDPKHGGITASLIEVDVLGQFRTGVPRAASPRRSLRPCGREYRRAGTGTAGLERNYLQWCKVRAIKRVHVCDNRDAEDRRKELAARLSARNRCRSGTGREAGGGGEGAGHRHHRHSVPARRCCSVNG